MQKKIKITHNEHQAITNLPPDLPSILNKEVNKDTSNSQNTHNNLQSTSNAQIHPPHHLNKSNRLEITPEPEEDFIAAARRAAREATERQRKRFDSETTDDIRHSESDKELMADPESHYSS